MSRSRVKPFREEHQLEYGLEVASRNPTTKEVDSVRCKFCIAFGKEGASTAARKRKVTDNIKYFTRPFRADNYKSHLKTHKEKWAEYQALKDQEKRVFFDLKAVKFVNTLDAHYEIDRKEHTFCFDNNIVEDIIGGMFFDLDEEEEYSSKERAMAIFKKKDTSDETYTACVKNLKQFRLIIKYISLGSSFRLASRIFQATKEELSHGQIGSVNKKKVIDYVRIVLATSLQGIKDLLCKSWCYSVAFDGASYIHTSYLDIRVRVFHAHDVQNIHVIALPMFNRHTGEYMHKLFVKLFDILDPLWKTKLVGITTDGAANMTGRHKGAVTKIQNSALGEGFYRLWCVLHQMDIVVQ